MPADYWNHVVRAPRHLAGNAEPPRVQIAQASGKVVEAELRDLRTVAAQAHLTQPAALLLSPANLAHALEAAQARQGDPQLRLRVDELSRRLFGSAPPKTNTNPA